MNQLKEIWEEVLQVEDIGEDDNFFDLGGDSLASLKVVMKAKEIGLSLSIRDIFEKQTLREIIQSPVEHQK